ncbi:MAG: hypothetical protein Q9163_001476 [Psora crenata]
MDGCAFVVESRDIVPAARQVGVNHHVIHLQNIMWTLECDGESLAGKRIWLRPGKRYLFGRTKPPDARSAGFRIDHKSVSRQHLTLSVSNVKPGDGSLLHTRSEITLKDEDTKFRTEIDGVRIKGASRILKKDEHVFRLGNSNQVFRLRWEPVVFTFSLTSKETKASKDPLASYRGKLEGLDIKVIVPYVIEATTHVVAGKRNTAKGLQALINAKYIVSESFINDVIYAATPTDFDTEESLSRLEEDFDANWPNPSHYLPEKSREPSERPTEDFLPNPRRAAVFEGYTFIFCDELQYGTLQAPITNGGGKALHFPLEPGQTSTDDIVRYAKSVAGEKGLGEFEDRSEGKGVVVVKFRRKGEHADWAAKLDYEVAQALDHRLIEQSEFLDAILTNDASILRKPLLPSEEDTSRTSGMASPSAALPAPAREAPTDAINTVVGRRNRKPIISRFKGFDDDEDDISIQPFPGADSMQVDSFDQPNSGGQNQSQPKRSFPSSDIEDEEELVDKILPAMKRRRLQMEADADQNGTTPIDTFDTSEPRSRPVKETKKAKEVSVKDAVRERTEAMEAAAKQDEENLRTTLEGISVEQMKNLAVVVEMKVPQRQPPLPRSTNGDENTRWDERWNGRKNFKKFRRRGEAAQPRRGQSVIVPLEEVRKKDYGIGEDYWLESQSEGVKRRKKDKDQGTQSQSQPTPHMTMMSDAVEIPTELVDGHGASGIETIDIDAPRSTRHQERSTHTAASSNNRSSDFQVVTQKQQGLDQMLPLPMGLKKRKKFAAAMASDSESMSENEEMKLRYAKRAR